MVVSGEFRITVLESSPAGGRVRAEPAKVPRAQARGMLAEERVESKGLGVGGPAAAHAALKAKGVTFESEPRLIAKMPDHDLWMAFFKDTENNTLALMCELRPS